MEIEVGGQIQGISLGSFLQIVHMDKTTCTLKIYSNDDIGYLYLKDGALVAAETGQLENVEAAYEILSWNKTVIIIDNAPIPNQKITVPLMSILMEGLRRKDEKNAQMGVQEVERKELDVEFDPETYVSRDEQIESQFVVGHTETESDNSQGTDPQFESDSSPEEPHTPPPVSYPEDIPIESELGKQIQEDSDSKDREETDEEEIDEEEIDESIRFEGEEELVKSRSPRSLIFRTAIVAIILSLATFGGLKFYQHYLANQNYLRMVDQVASQRDLQTMKRLLNTYINARDDDDKYILDAISKMNDVNTLIDIERKVAAMPLNSSYRQNASELYREFLSSRENSFLKEYIKVKTTEIPKILEEHDYETLLALTKESRPYRLKVYRDFLAHYPKSSHQQTVQNLIDSIGDEYYADLSAEIRSCNSHGQWNRCVDFADDFIREFPNDTRISDIMDVRKKMHDRAEFADLKFKSSAMDFSDAKKLYFAYLHKYPDTSVKQDIRDEITLLNRKIDMQTKWDEAYAYCTNADISIDKRIRELEEYMARDYSGLFKEKSQALMQDLKKEEKIGRIRMAQILKDRQEKERLAKIQAEKDRIAREKEEARLRELRRQQREEHLNRETQRITKILQASGGRFKVHSDRTVTDTHTGLIWCLIDSNIAEGECMNYNDAVHYVRNLTVGGYKDWRMPDSGELAVLYNSKPYYPSSGASWYWTLRSLDRVRGFGEKAAVFFPDRKEEFEQIFKDQSECGFVHAVRP